MITPISLVLYTLVYGNSLASAAVANSSQIAFDAIQHLNYDRYVVEDLNTLLSQAIDTTHLTSGLVSSYVADIDAQLGQALQQIQTDAGAINATTGSPKLSELLTPYFSVVTEGAKTLLSSIDKVSVESSLSTSLLTSYQRLVDFSSHNGVDTRALSDIIGQLNQKLKEASAKIGSGSKRTTSGNLDGVNGAVNNFKTTMTALMNEINNDPGHSGADTLVAILTGLDAQTDNLAATILNTLNPVTFGLSGDLGDFLLGPIVQGLTNGAEVMIGNLLGGAVDLWTAPAAKLFEGVLTKNIDLAKKVNVKTTSVEALEDVQKQWTSLYSVVKFQAFNASVPIRNTTSY